MWYVYLLSALPDLEMKSIPSISTEEFLTLCADYLTSSDMQILYYLSEHPDVPFHNEFRDVWVQQWVDYNNSLRALLGLRRLQVSQSHLSEQRVHSWVVEPYAVWQLDSVIHAADPLKREWALLACQWEFLDILEACSSYGKENLFSYAVRLQLLHRIHSLLNEKGREVFTSLQESLVKELPVAMTYYQK